MLKRLLYGTSMVVFESDIVQIDIIPWYLTFIVINASLCELRYTSIIFFSVLDRK